MKRTKRTIVDVVNEEGLVAHSSQALLRNHLFQRQDEGNSRHPAAFYKPKGM
ncbi:hypothetical protein [Paenibacillus odorifer]|uniref:hypothetical protein n=1 Tax=Paenibacillus odorifer TaxID=189426 RepID=UPI002DB970A3|nr:hypothetical protein [Paenibacillus odorifer]MEC0129670.1 hypothetical protein [Paenibacillus odorifer]